MKEECRVLYSFGSLLLLVITLVPVKKCLVTEMCQIKGLFPNNKYIKLYLLFIRH